MSRCTSGCMGLHTIQKSLGPAGGTPGAGGAAPSFAGRAGFAVGRWSRLDRRRLEPARWVPRPVPGGGSRLSLEKARTQRVAGGPPAPPFFRGRSFPLARFGVVGRRGTIVVFICNHFRALIWGLSFGKILFSIFSLENASQIGFSILEVIASRTHQRKLPQKLASGNERL